MRRRFGSWMKLGLLAALPLVSVGAFAQGASDTGSQAGEQQGSQQEGSQQEGVTPPVQGQGEGQMGQGQMGQAGQMGKKMGNLSQADSHFVQRAAQDNLAEIQLGQLAVTNGSSQQVKDLGRKLVDDHTKAQNQLKQIAERENVTLPSQPSVKAQQKFDKLSKLSGQQFDQAFMQGIAQSHKQAISLFSHEANNGQNDQLKDFASSTLPTLKQHENMANRNMNKM